MRVTKEWNVFFKKKKKEWNVLGFQLQQQDGKGRITDGLEYTNGEERC